MIKMKLSKEYIYVLYKVFDFVMFNQHVQQISPCTEIP
jgi:hypothetical protein